MKIICESMDEYDRLMIASKYLHDFRVGIEDFLDEEDQMNESLIFGINDNDNEIIGFFQHLYLTEKDFPNKREVVIVKELENEQ